MFLPGGFFPSGVQAWFVNHTAGIIFQVPTCVWTFALSALNIHYNADTQGCAYSNYGYAFSLLLPLEFLVGGAPAGLVTTIDYERPTEFNTTPLNSLGTGRGSIVLYNQASFAHWFVAGERYMSAAREAYGKDGLSNLFAAKAQEVIQFM